MEPSFIPLAFERLSPEESRDRASRFLAQMRRRRTVPVGYPAEAACVPDIEKKALDEGRDIV